MKHLINCYLLLFAVYAYPQQHQFRNIAAGGNPVNSAAPGDGQNAQNTIKFDYDVGGNQIKRSFIYVNSSKQDDEDDEGTSKNELKKSEEYNDISYYPNPVKSELFVKWNNTAQSYVTGIEIYSNSGQSIRKQKGFKNIDNTTVSFEDLPVGIYNLILIYNNGQKTLRIVKQ